MKKKKTKAQARERIPIEELDCDPDNLTPSGKPRTLMTEKNIRLLFGPPREGDSPEAYAKRIFGRLQERGIGKPSGPDAEREENAASTPKMRPRKKPRTKADE